MQSKGLVTRFGIGMLVAMFGLAASVQAQTGSQFQRIARLLRLAGYSHTVDTTRGWLRDGRAATFSIWLAAGRDYAVAGDCDADCSDVDLVLYASNGAAVAWDRLYDDQPIMRVTPRRSGLYRLRVSMADCERQPCGYMVGVFRR
jgi:hypothetical protein